MMRLTALLLLFYLALAAPNQLVLEEISYASYESEHAPGSSWVDQSLEFVKQNGIAYELVTHPEFPEYRLRVTEPKICDPTVQQYSGYLDITDGKHLFFWFFESRSAPSEDPLVLWLNGGPGCSSIGGLLFELGPCTIVNEGYNTTYNGLSWTAQANVLFLDQPVNVGYSYSDDGSTVSTTAVVAEDVWSFLQLFVRRYRKYAKLQFHISGESYAGTYLPNIGAVIHKHNKEIAHNPFVFAPKGIQQLNLVSILIGNGLTSPMIQFSSIPRYACEGPYPIFNKDGPECASLYGKLPICLHLIESCYKFNSRLTCVPADFYCWSQMYGSFQKLGLNPYDVRKKCNREEDGQLCYKQLPWIDRYMNDVSRKRELGVADDIEFQSCNLEIQRAFHFQGDSMHDPASLLPELIVDGIRLLVYAGNADFVCNAMGVFDWIYGLDNLFSREFHEAKTEKYVTVLNGTTAGEVRSAGGKGLTAGNLTYVKIYEAGHMVPFDQPEAALDMFTRWIKNVPLTV